MSATQPVDEHLQQEHDFTGWTIDTFRRQFPALVTSDGYFAFAALHTLLHDPNAETKLIVAQMVTISTRTCEACKVPLTAAEQEDFVTLCEVCAGKIDPATEEELERQQFDDLGDE
jgi:hypothetical protein